MPNPLESRTIYNPDCGKWQQFGDNKGYANNIQDDDFPGHTGPVHVSWDCSGGDGVCASFRMYYGNVDCHYIELHEDPNGIAVGNTGGSGSCITVSGGILP